MLDVRGIGVLFLDDTRVLFRNPPPPDHFHFVFTFYKL